MKTLLLHAAVLEIKTVKTSKTFSTIGTACGRLLFEAVFLLTVTLCKFFFTFKKTGEENFSRINVVNHRATCVSMPAYISTA